jgi:hypothetical protein
MNHFGERMHVLNKNNFEDFLYKENLDKMRRKIYFFMLNNQSENDFFDIEEFNRKYVRNMDKTNKMVNEIVLELNQLGWKTHLGFGNTGLYIYSSEELPSSAW